MFRYLLMFENDEPADPAMLVRDDPDRVVDERFAASDGSRWRIISILPPPEKLIGEIESMLVVAPMD